VAIRQDITSDDEWFAGEDRIFEFTVYDPGAVLNEDDGIVYTDRSFTTPADPLDLTDMEFEWALRESPRSADAVLTKTTADTSMITVLDQNTDTGKLRVFINGDEDTADLSAGKYAHALARTAEEFEVCTYGQAILKLSAVHRAEAS
jgi:hypothetical protein